MSKIVLFRPKSSVHSLFPSLPRVPLGLLYVGTILSREGYDVRIIDATVDDDYVALADQECKDAMLVGITALTSEVKGGLEISSFIKERHDVPIVWGGIHPSLFPVLTCEDPLVDFAVLGEGEYTLLELVRALEKDSPLEGIEGLAYREEGLVKINQPRPYVDLAKLPPLDYDLVDMAKYLRSGAWRRDIDVQTSRGCPSRCKFCVNPVLGNRILRAMPAKRVADECERLSTAYGIEFVTFVDDNFFVSRPRVKEICEEFIERKLDIKWFAELRADYFRPGFVDEDFLELAEAAGLTNLTIGAESGVPRLLELMGKDITVDDVVRSANMLATTDIATAYSFIIGLPTEDRDDILTTLQLVETLWKLYPKASYSITTLRAYPGCELTDYFVRQGWIHEPQSLREFAQDAFSKVYTESPAKLPWHCDPDFVYAIAYFTSIAYGPFSRKRVKEILGGFTFLLLPELLLQRIARVRLEHRFFKFLIDIWLHKALQYAYRSGVAKSFVRWRDTPKSTAHAR
ncbi:MAG: radical SAM protein [Dehalococcoidia bacterium]